MSTLLTLHVLQDLNTKIKWPLLVCEVLCCYVQESAETLLSFKKNK